VVVLVYVELCRNLQAVNHTAEVISIVVKRFHAGFAYS
jgi:hypothetical protein